VSCNKRNSPWFSTLEELKLTSTKKNKQATKLYFMGIWEGNGKNSEFGFFSFFYESGYLKIPFIDEGKSIFRIGIQINL